MDLLVHCLIVACTIVVGFGYVFSVMIIVGNVYLAWYTWWRNCNEIRLRREQQLPWRPRCSRRLPTGVVFIYLLFSGPEKSYRFIYNDFFSFFSAAFFRLLTNSQRDRNGKPQDVLPTIDRAPATGNVRRHRFFTVTCTRTENGKRITTLRRRRKTPNVVPGPFRSRQRSTDLTKSRRNTPIRARACKRFARPL